MDEELRDSLMEWYLRYGGREIVVFGLIGTKEWTRLRDAWRSQYIVPTRKAPDEYKLSPEGIEALKNG
jgi:hypothetical protein